MKDHRDFLAGMTVWNRSEGEQLTHTQRMELFHPESQYLMCVKYKVRVINRGCSSHTPNNIYSEQLPDAIMDWFCLRGDGKIKWNWKRNHKKICVL